MKIVISLFMILNMFTGIPIDNPCPPDFDICFKTYTPISFSIDEIYKYVEDGTYEFEGECPDDKTLITWDDVKLLFEYSIDDNDSGRFIINRSDMADILPNFNIPKKGVLSIDEDYVYVFLLKQALDGTMLACKPEDSKAGLYGSGVYNMIQLVLRNG